MMRPTMRFTAVFGACAVTLALLVAASAQERPQDRPQDRPEMRQSGQSGQFTPDLVRATNLMGAEVKNNKGETLGTIEELVLKQPPYSAQGTKTGQGHSGSGSGMEQGHGQQSGQSGQPGQHKSTTMHSMSRLHASQIEYVVLSSGGFLGIGDKYFAIPWSAFDIRSPGLKGAGGEAEVTLNIEKQRIENAPGFDKDNWPDTGNQKWAQEIQQYYSEQMRARRGMQDGQSGGMQGDRPYGVHEGNKGRMEHRKLSELKGSTVNDQQGQEIGELRDCILDTRDGVLAFAVLEGIETQQGDDVVAVPWNSLNFQLRQDEVVCRLDMPMSDVKNVAIGETNFGRLTDMSFAGDLYQRFDQEPYWETFGYIGEGSENRKDESGRNVKEKAEQKEREKRDWDYR